METKFYLRRCVSLTLGLSFLVMTATGLVLFVAPKGKVAYWSDWVLFGLGKAEWTALHITSMVLLIVSAVWHIYFNWSPLVSYLKNSAKKLTPFKAEFLTALALNVIFVTGTIYNVPPFKTLIDFNDAIKNYWERTEGSPPYGHAEASTLKAFTRYIGQTPEEAMALLKSKGLKVSGVGETLESIARNNQMTPQQVYTMLKPGGAAKSSKGEGQSDVTYLGRRTLGELAQMEKIDLEKSLAYLKKKGLDADEGMRMREVADFFEVTPYEMYGALQKVSAKK